MRIIYFNSVTAVLWETCIVARSTDYANKKKKGFDLIED